MTIEVQHRSQRHAGYDDAEVQDLSDRMGPTYDIVNLISSFGLSEFWRRQCVRERGFAI